VSRKTSQRSAPLLIASITLALVAAVAAVAPLAAQGPTAASSTGLVVSPEWLAARLADPSVVVLHVAHDDDYEAGHLPGARKLEYGRIVTRRGTVGSELPDDAALRAVFEELGVSDGSTVVVYAHEAPMATRVLFSLSYLGLTRIAYLDGGAERWQAEGRALTKDAPAVTRGRLSATPLPALVATAEWIQGRLARPGLALIDTRTDGEYNGTGNRSGMPSAGHLAGARQLQWEELFSDGRNTLKSRADLERLFRDRTQAGDTVVTYCWVGYRASATWFVARWLGYEARMYDGSYQDWSQRGHPTKVGATP
jgi:thiosulfate/3-mercaptopyruvate sulfurtransferase